MVRHNLKILQHFLHNFKSVSDNFETLCIKRVKKCFSTLRTARASIQLTIPHAICQEKLIKSSGVKTSPSAQVSERWQPLGTSRELEE